MHSLEESRPPLTRRDHHRWGSGCCAAVPIAGQEQIITLESVKYLSGYRTSSRVGLAVPNTDRPMTSRILGQAEPRQLSATQADKWTTAILETMRLGKVHYVRRNTANRGFHERAFTRAPRAQSSQAKSPSTTHQWIWGVSPILAESHKYYTFAYEQPLAQKDGLNSNQ